jgi:glycosyltransferase involved in cell wall biosynthesis
VFAVADSLRQLALRLGVPEARTRVVGNGVDVAKFHPVERAAARRELGLPADAPVLISVGGLVERKGFHRVIELLPALRRQFPDLRYLVVGGGGPEGDWSQRLRDQVAALGLQEAVHFLGPWPPERLKVPLSAADVFVLATSNEGWANVFLEAMACGLPVVTTDVGGNAEVVCDRALGTVVPFGDADALRAAIAAALARDWDRAAIRRHAEDNDWDGRVAILVAEFRALCADRRDPAMR